MVQNPNWRRDRRKNLNQDIFQKSEPKNMQFFCIFCAVCVFVMPAQVNGLACDSEQQLASDYYCSLDYFGKPAASRCNNGKCIGDSTGVRCQCPPNAIGPFCEEKQEIDFCGLQFGDGKSASSVCRPPHGTCVNTANGVSCICHSADYSGDTCQKRKRNSSSTIVVIGGYSSGIFQLPPRDRFTNQYRGSSEFYIPFNTTLNRLNEEFGLAWRDDRLGRRYHVVGIIDSHLVLVGGYWRWGDLWHESQATFSLPLGGSESQEWQRGPNLARSMWHQSGGVIDHQFVVCGGASPEVLASCQRLVNLTQWDSIEWESIAPMSEQRYKSASAQFDHKLCMIGGCALYGIDGEGGWMKSVECWDPESDSWSPMPEIETPRYLHTAASYNNTMAICGGYAENPDGDGRSIVIDGCEIYSVEKNLWVPMPSMKHKRAGHSMVDFNGQLMVFGGESTTSHDDDDPSLISVELYDNAKEEWVEGQKMIEPRFGAAAIVLD